jgi:multidrug efflux pump
MNGINLSRWAVTHRAVVLFLMIVTAVAGVYAYLGIGRAEDPSFTIKAMIVTAAWPGATAQEVQDQLADKIEKKLQELEYFDHVRTYCRPGMMAVELSLKDTTPAAQVANQWYQVRKKINDIRGTLPEGVIGPMCDDEYGDVYTAVFALTGNGYTAADLKHFAEDARQHARVSRRDGRYGRRHFDYFLG